MILFFCFVFLLIGLLAGLYSLFFLLLLIPMFFYLFYYRKYSRYYGFLFLFTAVGWGLIFCYPKGDTTLSEISGIVIYQKENYYLLLSLSGKYYIYDKSTSLTFFSIVHLTGYGKTIAVTHYESRFDFAEYLKTKGVFLQFYPSSKEVLFQPFDILSPIKKYLFSYCEEDTSLLLSSLLFGDSFSSLEEYDSLSSMGIASSLSLSGFHLSFLLAVIKKILGKKYEKYFPYLELSIASLFLFLSSFRYSMKRIFLLSLFSLLSQKSKQKLDYLGRISAVAIIMLLFEPYSLTNGAFYYPFPLLFLLALFPEKKKDNWKGKIEFLIEIFFFYLPFRFYQSPTFNLFSPFLQLILLPFSHLLFLFSFLLIIPYTGFVLNYLVSLFLSLAEFINDNSLFLTNGSPLFLFTISYYMIFFVILLCRTYHFPIQRKHAEVTLCLALTTIFIPDVFPHEEVTFIDVGQGDCTLIRQGYTNIMIDTGGNTKIDLAQESLIPYLEKRKIASLDAVLITHLDYDHYGALESLVSHYQVDHVYYAKDFLNATDNTLTIGDLKVTDLNTYATSEDSDDNNTQSAVFQFTVNQTDFLVMGDATQEIELKIIADHPDLDCDVIKVGHHGSQTSSAKEFLKTVTPELAIISCGLNNSYGHPHEVTLNTLSSLSIPYRRTDEEGTITLNC